MLRDRQVWIGPEGTPIEQSRFVPPPYPMVEELLADWELFVHDDDPIPPLVRCAMMHYQFETIHPFNDGNGRIGRLLIPLLLIERGVLSAPLLYLSAYFEAHRTEYHDQLFQVSMTGDWRPWLMFFLTGVAEQTRDAIERSRELRSLQEVYRRRLHEEHASASALRAADHLFIEPIVTRASVAGDLGLTVSAVRNIMDRLVLAHVVEPIPNTYPQLYVAREILEALQ